MRERKRMKTWKKAKTLCDSQEKLNVSHVMLLLVNFHFAKLDQSATRYTILSPKPGIQPCTPNSQVLV